MLLATGKTRGGVMKENANLARFFENRAKFNSCILMFF